MTFAFNKQGRYFVWDTNEAILQTMIRSNLPLPFLYRLSLRAGSAARKPAAESAGRTANPRQAAPRRPAVGDAAQLWLNFIDHYEQFTDVLCAAAKSGCDPRRESEYAQLRRWFVANYYRLSARLRPALEGEFSPQEIGLRVADYSGQTRPLDALEALFLPSSLRATLGQDDGGLIPRVARVSEVVYRCHSDWEAERKN